MEGLADLISHFFNGIDPKLAFSLRCTEPLHIR
jgi:hypothetical protein